LSFFADDARDGSGDGVGLRFGGNAQGLHKRRR